MLSSKNLGKGLAIIRGEGLTLFLFWFTRLCLGSLQLSSAPRMLKLVNSYMVDIWEDILAERRYGTSVCTLSLSGGRGADLSKLFV